MINEFSKMIENIDIICELAQETISEKDKLQKIGSMNSMTNLITKSPVLLKIGVNHPNFNNNAHNLSLHQNLAKLAGTSNKDMIVDYNLIYFFKYSLNYIYDYYLTINKFHAFKINKYQISFAKLNLCNFLNYMTKNMFILSKSKGINIEVNCKVKDDVIVNYEYTRLIVFNLLNFILNNSSGSYQTEMKLTVDYENISEKEGLFKFCLEFIEPSPIVEYSLIREILDKNDTLDLSFDEIDKFKYLDIGIFVANFIIKNIYNKAIAIDSYRSDAYKVTFYVCGKHLENKNLYQVHYIFNLVFIPWIY